MANSAKNSTSVDGDNATNRDKVEVDGLLLNSRLYDTPLGQYSLLEICPRKRLIVLLVHYTQAMFADVVAHIPADLGPASNVKLPNSITTPSTELLNHGKGACTDRETSWTGSGMTTLGNLRSQS